MDRVGLLDADADGCWETRDVIGPRDACWITRIRELMRPHGAFGLSTPIDLFLLSVGESPDRTHTKIGGLPFWPRERDWPKSITGEPLPFLAQFCFRDSLDIVDSVPEDILLLFGNPDLPSSIVARWESSTSRSRLVDCSDMPDNRIVPCFYGTRWRTESFPEAAHPDPVLLADGTAVLDTGLVSELLGLQIGPGPYFPRWSGRPGKAERVVCAMSSVFPIPDRPYPFINRPQPLTTQEAEHLAVPLTAIKDKSGFSVVWVVVADSGEPSVVFEELG